MKNYFFCLLLLLVVLPVNAGLYDDILEKPTIQEVMKERYSKCDNKECIDRVHQENMEILNQKERALMFLMQENQIRTMQNTPLKIQYGYNSMGEYVPTNIGGQNIHYGYNAYGDFVPMYIGD